MTKNFNGFLTPDQTAAKEEGPVKLVKTDNEDMPKKKRITKRFSLSKLSRRSKIVLFILLVLIIAVLVAVLSGDKSTKTVKAHIVTSLKNIKPSSDLVPSTLSGLPVNPNVNKLPVTAVMVENSLDARPQSGLSQAMVVFEAVAEGGVTRFMALYQDTSPDNVGPVRSARPYYVQWELGFDAGYAHVGGSTDALNDIKTWNVRDLNQFYNANYYHRITTREAPHNVYTSISLLNQLEDSKGYTSSTYSGFPRTAASPAKVPTVTSINMSLSGPDYNVAYTYDPTTNSYNRDEGGAPQMDANTNTQISPKVVIGIVVPETQGALDTSGAYYSDYNVIGSGTAYIFQDGVEQTGHWTKSSNTSQITFTTDSGQTIDLIPGQTWITALTSSSDISY